MFTVVVAWLAVLAVCVAAASFGQAARTSARQCPARRRTGLFVSRSGPWLTALAAAAAGAATGAWLPAAAAGAGGIVLVALLGLGLSPH
ncbi:hypothetical protein [Blastococcus saxobsidens]|uniref:Uncharacterized protein n=1 Tax=Blastococcus saxobsidens (strain DD2) TaxID=1146883 RepID=H6RPU4_BLASD|nr:hypothetical protein [Blastococcus saxobsidens]CCG01513.1 membrane protein of unknown function [Blastococcus saxobsidens DD2]